MNVEEKDQEIKVMRMIDKGKPIFKLQYKNNWFFQKNRITKGKKGIENTFSWPLEKSYSMKRDPHMDIS